MNLPVKIATVVMTVVILTVVASIPAIAHETYYYITNYDSGHQTQNQPALVYSSDSVQTYGQNDKHDIIHKIAQRFNLNEQELRDYLKQLHTEYFSNRDYQENQDIDDNQSNVELQSNFHNYYGDRYSKHLNFIDQKLTEAVQNGKIYNDQRRRVLDKLQHLMASEENYYNARHLTVDEKQIRINSWKKDMSAWAERNGLTLSQLREITGKGNKFLMGVDY